MQENDQKGSHSDDEFEAVVLSDHFESDSVTDDDSSSGSYTSESSFNDKNEEYRPYSDVDIDTVYTNNSNDDFSYDMRDIVDNISVDTISVANNKRHLRELDEIYDIEDDEPPKKKSKIVKTTT